LRFISLSDATENDYLGKDVFNSKGYLLVRKGTILNQDIVSRLTNNKILSAYVTDAETEEIVLELDEQGDFELPEMIDDALRSEFNQRIKKAFDDFAKEKEDTRYSDAGETLHFNVYKVAMQIIGKVLEAKERTINKLDIKHLDIYDYEHAVNTAILAVTLGVSLGCNEKELITIASGSILMNIGAVLIDSSLVDKPGNLTQDETTIMKSHPELGRRLLNNKSTISAQIKNIVLNHHERVNGTGYPRGLKKDAIDLYSRIVMIADVFDSMTSDRHHRKAYSASEALEYIMGNGDIFDYTLATQFAKSIVAYPVGEYVQLSCNSIGLVIKCNKGMPLRPVIRVTIGNKKGETIDLKQELNITILRKSKRI